GQLDAGREILQRLVIGQRLRRNRGNRAPQIVGDADQLAGKGGDGVFARLLAVALGPPSDVLGLRQRPQQLVLERRRLGLARGQRVGRRRVFARDPRGRLAVVAVRPVLVLVHVSIPRRKRHGG